MSRHLNPEFLGPAALNLCMHAKRKLHRYFSEGSKQYHSPYSTYVVGPCTGGFAAAAVSWSQTVPDLVHNGVRAALAAFRTALKSFLVGQSLSLRMSSTQPNKSWSVALSARGEIGVRQLLGEYAKSQVKFFRVAASANHRWLMIVNISDSAP